MHVPSRQLLGLPAVQATGTARTACLTGAPPWAPCRFLWRTMDPGGWARGATTSAAWTGPSRRPTLGTLTWRCARRSAACLSQGPALPSIELPAPGWPAMPRRLQTWRQLGGAAAARAACPCRAARRIGPTACCACTHRVTACGAGHLSCWASLPAAPCRAASASACVALHVRSAARSPAAGPRDL